MVLEGGRKNNDIIQVAEAGGPFETAQERVHHALEDRRGVAYVEMRDLKLVQAVGGNKNGLLTVPFVDSYLPVHGTQTVGGKITGTVQAVESVINSWKGIDVFLCDVIETEVVDAEPPGLI